MHWLFPVRAVRARAAYRYLFGHFESALERRLQRRVKPGVEDEGPRDPLETLVSLKLEPSGGKARWSHGECVEELISLVAGGTDAMSSTLAQALYLLSRNPDVQDEARARVLQAGDPGRSSGDPFVLNVVHETMRLFPAVPFSSKISEARSIEVEGVTIPARTNVMWMKTAVGLNERSSRTPGGLTRAGSLPDQAASGRQSPSRAPCRLARERATASGATRPSTCAHTS